MNIVVMGSGAAAISSINTMRRITREENITLISPEREIYSRCLLPNLLSNEIDKEKLLYHNEDFYEKMRVNTIFKAAKGIDPFQKKIILDDDSIESYDRLLIATGSHPKSLPIEGIENKGIFFFKTLGDAKMLLNWIESENPKKAVVIGVGYMGVEVAIALRKAGLAVTSIGNRDRVLPRMLDREMAGLVQQKLEDSGIEIELESKAFEIRDVKMGKEVVLNNKRIQCDLVVIAIGETPVTGMLEDSGIEIDEGIVVDEYLRTSNHDIFAAGDVALSYDIVVRERVNNRIWLNAVKQGKYAAYNILGNKRQYEGSVRCNVLNIFDLPVVTIGYIQPDCEIIETCNRVIAIKENRIVGLSFVGDIENAGVLFGLMKKGADITKIKDSLIKKEFGYGRLVKYFPLADIA